MVDTPEEEASIGEEVEEEVEILEEEDELDENLKALKRIDEEVIDEETIIKEEVVDNMTVLIQSIKLLDTASELPRVFTLKLMDQFKEKYVEPYGARNVEFAKIWNEIEPDLVSTISKGEDLAEAKGGIFKMSFRKASLITMIPILGIIVGLMVLFSFIGMILPPEFGMFTYVIMFLPICILCFGQPYIDRYLKKMWEKKRDEIKPKFKEVCQNEIDQIRASVQKLITLANSEIVEYKVRPERIQFTLFYSDYDGIMILGQEQQKYYTVYYAQLSS